MVHCRVQVREGEQRFLIAVVGSQVSLPCTESNTECSISTYRRLGPILSSIVRINHEDIRTLRRNRAAIYARELPGSSRNREALVEDCTGVLCQVGVSTKRPRQCGAARACTLTRQGDLKLSFCPFANANCCPVPTNFATRQPGVNETKGLSKRIVALRGAPAAVESNVVREKLIRRS